jgi:hypothetical protein
LGNFTNGDIGGLFNSLTARGMESDSEALLFGGSIDEYDIPDKGSIFSQPRRTGYGEGIRRDISL